MIFTSTLCQKQTSLLPCFVNKLRHIVLGGWKKKPRGCRAFDGGDELIENTIND